MRAFADLDGLRKRRLVPSVRAQIGEFVEPSHGRFSRGPPVPLRAGRARAQSAKGRLVPLQTNGLRSIAALISAPSHPVEELPPSRHGHAQLKQGTSALPRSFWLQIFKRPTREPQERKMHGVVGNSQRSDSAKMAKLREALALAREQLMRAVSDRGADTV